MNPKNRAIIEAAIDQLADTLTGDNAGLRIDAAWDGACVTIHIATALCDHPPGGHR